MPAGRSPITTPSGATTAPGTTGSARSRLPVRSARPSAKSILRAYSTPAFWSTPPPNLRRPMSPLVASLRPQEWIKNLLVFAGVIFSRQFDEGQALLDATITFVAFCAISSAGYLFNDLRDREHDRLHPEKRTRPIASGALAPEPAVTAAVALAAFALVLPWVTVHARGA